MGNCNRKLPKIRLTAASSLLPEWMSNPYYTQGSQILNGETFLYGALVRILSSSMVEILVGDFIPAILLSLGKSVIIRHKPKCPQAGNIFYAGMQDKLLVYMRNPSAGSSLSCELIG